MNKSYTQQFLENRDLWKPEIDKVIRRNFIIGAIISLTLNSAYGIVSFVSDANPTSDAHLGIRALVGITILFFLFFRDRFRNVPEWLMFIPFFCMVCQDAYIFSTTPLDQLPSFSLTHISNFIGAALLIIWEPYYSILFFGSVIVLHVAFYLKFTDIPLDLVMQNGGWLLLAVIILTAVMIHLRFTNMRDMIIARLEMSRYNEWMETQNNIIEEKSKELQKSNNRLTEFAYIVSHDLKAPLRGIRNLSTWIREDSYDSLNDDGKQHFRLLEKQVVKMENLIKAVLDYSKTGAAGNQKEWVNLDELVNDVIEFVSIDERTNFELKIGVKEVKGSKVVLQQVLQNLLSNSIKHNHNQERKVAIEIKELNDSFEFSVSDNGPGIHPDDHSRVFDLFQTLHGESSFESTGIGLPIAKKMIEDCGGDLWLESEPGHGARFYFTIPKVA